MACDRLVEHPDPTERRAAQTFAAVLVDDLAARATTDHTGARWSNHEHRVTPINLQPRTGWAMGNAGIIRELLRYIRARRGQEPGYTMPWPGHHPTRPETNQQYEDKC